MDIDKLMSFIEVYNCLNISRAAENLFISQSALSRRIQALEEELKVLLFERNGNILTATEVADILYKDARKIIKQHAETIVKMNSYRLGKGGTLRIATEASTKLMQTLRAIAQFQNMEPDVEMLFNCDQDVDILHLLLERKIDLAVTYLGEIRAYEGVKYERIYNNALTLMIGRNHPLWGKKPLYAKDLNGVTVCYRSALTSTTWETIMLKSRAMGIEFAEMVPCRSFDEELMYIATGKAVAFHAMINYELLNVTTGIIDNVPVSDVNLDSGDVVVAYVEETPQIRKFIDIIKMVK